ncbi:MAG: exo-alpha-sialidase, partial [Bacteroidales bacterium]|nr:exo-alpha-sialidase [Bacteroidales bacterium]
ILLCCDAGPDGEAGTSLHVSKDGGKTWEDTGSTIAGIHAGIVERKDGSLMAFGRGNAIDGRMPCSISYDGGYTWTYTATEFPSIGSGQRLVLKRLQEGPILLCSFGENGLFVALSYDEGATWPVKKLLTDGKTRVLDGGAWTGTFTMDATHAEPKGYLACTQTPDGMIHLLSSRVHYRFNLPWIEK